MGKIRLLIGLVFILCTQHNNAQKPSVNTPKTIEEWKKSIVNIVAINEKYANTDSTKFPIEFGTATFFIYKDRRYLLTARHIVMDIPHDAPPTFNRIFLQPRYNDYIKDQNTTERFTQNSLTGRLAMAVTFGQIIDNDFSKNDIAIISLEHNSTKDLLKAIETNGYSPISIELFNQNPKDHITDEVISIGFSPSIIAGTISYDKKINGMAYLHLTEPLVAFGRLSMLHDSLNYYVANLTTLPGFSGSPIILNNKIIGVTHGSIKYNKECPTSGFSTGTLLRNFIKLLEQTRKLEELRADN